MILKESFVAKLLFVGVIFFGFSAHLQAGIWEISGNGSYFRYNNGTIGGEPSRTTVIRLGAGIAYRFLRNTSVQLTYTKSRNTDIYTQNTEELSSILRINKQSNFQNLSLNIVLDFAPKGATFKPFIKGGGGYILRSSTITGTAQDKITDEVSTLTFSAEPESGSASADGGLGFKIFVADAVAIEIEGTVFATDLDKAEIFLHYSFSGGLRFIF